MGVGLVLVSYFDATDGKKWNVTEGINEDDEDDDDGGNFE